MPVCAVCGYETSEAFKFCPECGAAAATSTSEQRKVVTVLFCDVVGSTALGESTDPEALRALLARYFARMKAIVERHGGTVEKFIGDAVMAVFGVPLAHEDDALRACRAALEMREAFVDIGVEGRIGVATGEVVTGTEERLATGDAVNLAVRLQQAAQPGEALVGEGTRALVRTAAELEAVEPLALKGKAEPVPAFRLRAVHQAEQRPEAPFVGRERELAAIHEAWERVLSERRCELVTIVGEAGVGKSRLVAEALASLDARVVQGRCLPYGEGITYWPVVETIKQLDAFPSDPAADAAIRSLLGESKTGTSAEEIAWAFRKLLEEAAPLIAVFDDIQWGEETFLDLIEHVALLSSGAPLLLLCMARPELVERRPSWPVALRLKPLRGENVEQLIGDRVPPDLRDRITKAAGGNPLFVGEMLAMAGEANGEMMVPPTLRALLAARLDQLEIAERRVLECGAVEGELFHRAAVQALAPEEIQVTPRLAALVRKELVRPDRAQLPGEDGFRFRHLLLRDAAYDGVPKSARAELHERFAAWLDERGGDLVELDEIVGYHLEQACRYRIEVAHASDEARRLAEQAADRLRAAGRRAFARDDAHAAVGLLGRAAALLPPDRRDAELLCDIGQARTDAGDLIGAEEALCGASARARERGDASSEALARLRLAFVQGMRDSASVPEEHLLVAANKAVATFTAHGQTARLAEALRAAAQAHLFLGNGTAARVAAEQARGAAEAAKDEREEGLALCDLVISLPWGPTPADEVATEAERVLALAKGRRRLRPQGFALVALGYAQALQGDFERASSTIGSALEVLREISPLWAAGMGAQICGLISLLANDSRAARAALEEGLDRLEQMDESGFLSTNAAMLAHVAHAEGDNERAEALVERARATAAVDDVLSQMLWRTALAKVEARRGRLDDAELLAREAVSIGAHTDYIATRADCLADLAELLRLAGKSDGASAALEQALALYGQKGNVVMAERARARLAALRLATARAERA